MNDTLEKSWVKIAEQENFPVGGGACVKLGDRQVAVFHFPELDKWFAVDNMCPHMKDMVLSRGLLGDKNGIPKVACPQHKRSFSLETGECLSGEDYCVETFQIKIENGFVYLKEN